MPAQFSDALLESLARTFTTRNDRYLTGGQVADRLGVHTEKGAIMGTVTQISQQISAKEREIERLRNQLEQVSKYTFLDELAEGSVVWFRIQFTNSRDKIYTYVMLKQGGMWHKTGQDGYGKSPAQIADWWSQHDVTDVWVAAEWATVEEMLSE